MVDTYTHAETGMLRKTGGEWVYEQDFVKAIRQINEAGHLLDDALAQLERTDHRWDCPRSRDDYDCTCGLSDVKARIKEWLSSE